MSMSPQAASTIDPDDVVWFIQEQIESEWQSIDQADDEAEASTKLAHFENTQPGTFRMYRSDWLYS